MTEQQKHRMWWLHHDGQSSGPYSEEAIQAGLRSGKISQQASVCFVGDENWQVIQDCLTFTLSNSRQVTAPLPTQTVAYTDSLFTNPQLPKMANWICLYCILVGPIIWGIDLMSCCAGGFSTPDENAKIFPFWLFMILGAVLFTLVITITQLIGGLKLKSLRQSGTQLIIITLWLEIVFKFIFYFVFAIGVVFLTGEHDYPEETTAQSLISYINLILFVCVLAFQIVALIWLRKYTKSLPLSEN